MKVIWKFFLNVHYHYSQERADNIFKKKSFRNSIRVSNGLDPDQDQNSVSLIQTVCRFYQKRTKDPASKERVNTFVSYIFAVTLTTNVQNIKSMQYVFILIVCYTQEDFENASQ